MINPEKPSAMRRILIIMDRRSLGGAQLNMLRLLSRLDRQRFEPIVLLPHDSSLSGKFQNLGIETWEKTIPAWRKAKCWVTFPFFVGSLVREIYARHIDLIFALDVCENPFAVLCGWFSGRQSLVWFQDSLIPSTKARSYLLHRTDAVVAISDYLAEKVHRLPARGQVKVIHNGIDTELFDPNRYHNRLRQDLSIPPDVPVLGMIGRIMDIKGQIQLIRALGILRQQGFQPKVIFAGDAKRAYREEMEKTIQALQLHEQVIFLGFHEEIAQVLAALDIFVLLSLNEGFSLAMAEAMAMGKPSVYSPVGGVLELTGDVDVGIPISRDEPEQIAAALRLLIEHPELRQQKGAHARERIQEHFSLQKQVQQFDEFLSSLLELK